MPPTLKAPGPIAANRLFKDVPDAVLQQLVRHELGMLNIEKDARLFEQGDEGGSMYVVREGRIEISFVSSSGKRIVLNQIGVGESLGEVSMMDGGVRTASASALEDSRLSVITRAGFIEASKTCPQLALNLLEIMSERIRWISSSVEEYSVHPLELRLARRLFTLHQNFARADGSVEISQSDLADFAGATREATNKILMNWKASGLIKLERKKVYLLETEKLARIANEYEGA